MRKIKPWAWILIALLLSLVVGGLVNIFGVATREPAVEFTRAGGALVGLFDYIGKIFMSLLMMIIVPLVFSSIVVGIAGLGRTEGFARLGGKTLIYYACSSLVAILAGLAFVNAIKPGLVDGEPNEKIVHQIETRGEEYAGAVASKVGEGGKDMGAVRDIFLRMVPENVFEAFGANDKMLSLIFVALLTGFGIIFLGEGARRSLLAFFQGLNELSLLITHWVMFLAPVGVFGLVAATVAQTGFPIIALLAKHFGTVLAALLFHLFVVLPLVLSVFRINPWRHFLAMRNALLTAFSTSSSSATLPVTMEALQENAGVSKRVSSFVLPLGATVNMDGTALYECVAVMFIVQVLGGDLSAGTQFTVVLLALLTSVGVAGVPSASLVAIVIIVHNVGIPNAEAVIGLLLAVDRPLDMTRTAVNVFSDSCAAVVIAKTEGEKVLEKGA